MTGRSHELASVLKSCHIDISCIQETKWKGAKARDIEEGFKLYYNGQHQARNGVGIMACENLRDSVVEINRLIYRILRETRCPPVDI